MDKKLKILFISRAYPPVLGGIENQNYGIGKALSEIAEVKIIANTRGKGFLPIFLVQATFQSLFILWKYDVVLFGDGVLAPLGVFLKLFHPKKKFASIVHGLDITYAHKKNLMGKIYRFINIPSLKRLNKLIMVGNQTIAEAVEINIPREKCFFIPNGFDESICEEHTREELSQVLGTNIADKKIILRVGRFVRHKGLLWFIENVMPQLPENYILVAAGGRVSKRTTGDSDLFGDCEKAIEKLNLQARVKLIPNIPQDQMNILFNTVDLFVSPNIKIHGSMEGFGINAIEGSACKKVVVASRLEGLQDAIYDGKNGFLVESKNTSQWVAKIKAILEADDFREVFGKRAQQFTNENFSWEKVAASYLNVLKEL